MKILKASITCLGLSVCFFCASAQQESQLARPYDLSKPRLFKELPEKINFKINEFDYLFDLQEGKNVDLSLASNFKWQGTVISRAEDAMSGVKSVVIKSSERSGATLTLSRIINQNNTLTYRGRIMSFRHGDAYDLVFENGSYYLLKKGLYDLYDE